MLWKVINPSRRGLITAYFDELEDAFKYIEFISDDLADGKIAVCRRVDEFGRHLCPHDMLPEECDTCRHQADKYCDDVLGRE